MRYENTSSRTLRVAADLLDTGLKTGRINTELFERKAFSRMALEIALMEDIALLNGGVIAFMKLTQKKLRQSGATPEDMDGIASLVRQIKGVEIGVMLREELNGSTRVSIRTGSVFDAGLICARMGGGGHNRAAGCVLNMPVEESGTVVMDAIRREYPDIRWEDKA
jgi:phosphoesterase RecJ-like protein